MDSLSFFRSFPFGSWFYGEFFSFPFVPLTLERFQIWDKFQVLGEVLIRMYQILKLSGMAPKVLGPMFRGNAHK